MLSKISSPDAWCCILIAAGDGRFKCVGCRKIKGYMHLILFMYDKGCRYRIILNRRKQEPGNALVSQVSGKFNGGQFRGRISILGIAVKVRKILLCY